MPPNAASCPDNDTFIFFFAKLPTFFYGNWSLGCPPGWMPGAVAPSAPPSLHATETDQASGLKENDHES